MSFSATYPFDLPLLQTDAPFLDERHYIGILKQARVELAELKGYCQALPNPMLLLSPALLQESLASSEIENIQTTVEEVLRSQLMAESLRGEPEKEVLRYREAIVWGHGHLPELAMSSRLILGIADQLTAGRYGRFRTGPNALVNSRTGAIMYTPPPAGRIPELLGNWERFVNQTTDGIDPLIKAAVAHYQFEAIHPFGDGNGRTGRILLILQLIDAGVLELPVLYLSGYINENKPAYYSLLRGVSVTGAWEDFIRFILQGLERQAHKTKQVLLAVMDLFKKTKTLLRTQHRDLYSTELVEILFQSPILSASSLALKLEVHRGTSSRYLNQLAASGFLDSITVGRNIFYVYRPLLKILQTS